MSSSESIFVTVMRKISQVASTKYNWKLFTLEFQIHVDHSNLLKFYFILAKFGVTSHNYLINSLFTQ